jgi:hypothetical protein
LEIRKLENPNGGINFYLYGEEEEFVCCKCKKQIKEGFMCENITYTEENKETNRLYCFECHKDCNMGIHIHDKRGEHKHIKFTKGKIEVTPENANTNS